MQKWWKQRRNLTNIIKLTISTCAIFTYCSHPAWPWAPVWHDDMLSTLMVYDGIKALSGAHRRRLEPRPWVALHRWRAVISVPCCQKSSPFFPKTPSICSISRGRVGALHFSAICCWALAQSSDQISITINTSVKVGAPKTPFESWIISIRNYSKAPLQTLHQFQRSLENLFISTLEATGCRVLTKWHWWLITGYSFCTWKCIKKSVRGLV